MASIQGQTADGAPHHRSLLDDLGEEVTGIIAPVSICMAVTVLLVKLLNPDGETSSSTVYIASIAYSENEGDSSGKKLGGALLNAIIFVAVIAGMTVILFLLFKYKCYKIIFAYMGFAVFNIFFFITGALFINVMQVIDLHIDAFSLAYGLFNFSVVGTLGLLFMPMPLLAKQGYLIWVGIITAYIFTFIPEWTSWVLLVLMALYDIAAVLIPGGPLKALVELAVERQQELPALIYEARPAGGRPYVRGWGNRGGNGNGQGPPGGPDGNGSSNGRNNGNGATDSPRYTDTPTSTTPIIVRPASGSSVAHFGAASSSSVVPLAGSGNLHLRPASASSAVEPLPLTQPPHRLSNSTSSNARATYSSQPSDPLGSGRLQQGGTSGGGAPLDLNNRPGIGRHRLPSSQGTPGSGGAGPVAEGREEEWQTLPPTPPRAAAADTSSVGMAPLRPHAGVVDAKAGGVAPAGGMASVQSASGLSSAGSGNDYLQPLIPQAPGMLSSPPGTQLRLNVGAGNQQQQQQPSGARPMDPPAVQGPLDPDRIDPDAEGQRRRGRDGEDDEDIDLPDAIKLGLGDFIFYSMLVGRAAMYDFMTVFSCYLAVIAGLGLTLLCLAIFKKALPALPFSIALGVLFYFLTRLCLEPYIVPLTTHLTFY